VICWQPQKIGGTGVNNFGQARRIITARFRVEDF
jgi:hypothetical protein